MSNMSLGLLSAFLLAIPLISLKIMHWDRAPTWYRWSCFVTMTMCFLAGCTSLEYQVCLSAPDGSVIMAGMIQLSIGCFYLWFIARMQYSAAVSPSS